MSFKIFSGSSADAFTKDICQHLLQSPCEIERKKFSCGEIYVRFAETIRGKDVYLVQTCRTGKMNDDLMELFLMIDAARQSFAKQIHVILPYYGYSRQDKIHAAREGISAKLLAKMIQGAGADHLVTLHLHSDQIQGFFNIPVDNINPRKLFVDYFASKNLENPVVVAPDAGAAKMAKKFADGLGSPLAILHKHRSAHSVAQVSHVIGDVKGKTPIIIDDMVDTASSVYPAKKALVEAGSSEDVYLAFTHPILSGPAIERLNEANFKEVVCTDSLPLEIRPNNLRQISIAPLLAEVVKNASEQQSVSKLYL